jgi:putative two-component system response regulator
MSDALLATAKILIVDDEEANVRYLQRVLEQVGATQVVTTTDARQALPLFLHEAPDLVILDLTMPHLDGFAVIAQLAPHMPADNLLPILIITADISPDTKRRALAAGARDFLTKPIDRVEALLRIRNLVEVRSLHQQLQHQNLRLGAKVQERTHDLESAQIEILERLALAAEYRDDDTGRHTKRVGALAARLALALGRPDREVELIRSAAPLHDVGKIGIPDHILLKPGRLDLIEIIEMQTHTTIGARILSGGQSDQIRLAQSIALTHHERWDGTGYPRNLRGARIPLAGRIVAIADTFDALTHVRPYKEAWMVTTALSEIAAQRGLQFDPAVVDAFLAMHPTAELNLVPAAPPVSAKSTARILFPSRI